MHFQTSFLMLITDPGSEIRKELVINLDLQV
jgi:hypothetical protein